MRDSETYLVKRATRGNHNSAVLVEGFVAIKLVNQALGRGRRSTKVVRHGDCSL